MASTRINVPLRGFLVPDERLVAENRVATGASPASAFTEAGPRAGGVAVPSASYSRGVFEVLGDQDDELEFKCDNAGPPGQARFKYRLTTESTSARRSWDTYSTLTRWSVPRFLDAGDDVLSLDMIALATGELLVCYRESDATNDAYTRSYDPSTDTWGTEQNAPQKCHRTMALGQLPDGHILLLTRRNDPTDLGVYWAVYRSTSPDDSTPAWSEHARHMFDNEPAADASRGRLLFLPPSKDLVYLHMEAGGVEQHASSSLGTKFTRIVDWAVGGTGVPDACVTPSGKLGVVTFDTTSTSYPTWYVVGSGFEDVSAATAVTVASVAVDQVWVMPDPCGRLYVFGRIAATDSIRGWYSDDDGATWTALDYGPVQHGAASAEGLQRGRFVHSLGTGWLFCQGERSASTADDKSLFLVGFGGYSNVVLTDAGTGQLVDLERGRLAEGYAVSTWTGLTYEPHTLPVNGWTTTGAAISVAGGYLRINPAASTTYVDKTTAPASGQTSAYLRCGGRVASGPATTDGTQRAGARLWLRNGATDWRMSLLWATGQFTVYNDSAGAVLATVSVDMTSLMQFRVFWEAGVRLEVYYKRPSSMTWILAYNGTGPGSTGGGSSLFRMGASSAATTIDAYYEPWALTTSTETVFWGTPLSTDPTPGRDWTIGRLCGGNAVPLGDVAASGNRVSWLRLRDGPLQGAETGTVAPAYDYPVDALDYTVAPSPRTPHRTTGDATDVALVWNPSDDEPTSLRGRTLALAVLRANYRSCYLDGWDGANWTALVTMDLATGFTGLSYTLSGDTVRINGGSAATRYVWRHELVGAHVDLGGGVHRKILAHTEGIWSTANGKHVELRIELQGGEAASGTCAIYAHSGVAVAHGISTLYERFRLRIPAQATAEDYFETGIALPGHVQPTGYQWSWGAELRVDPNASTRESASGTTYRRGRGPGKPTLVVPWVDGLDLSRLRDASPTPDFLAHGAVTEGLANLYDVGHLLQGLLEELRSGEIPVVALLQIPTTDTTITDPTLFLYGRIVSSVQVEYDNGNEGTDEVVRVQSVTVEGIV